MEAVDSVPMPTVPAQHTSNTLSAACVKATRIMRGYR